MAPFRALFGTGAPSGGMSRQRSWPNALAGNYTDYWPTMPAAVGVG